VDQKEDSMISSSGFITEFDIYLFGQGNHLRIYEKLGSHIVEDNEIKGVHFAVWAPNAEEVSVIGSFNGWNPKKDKMKPLGQSGIWILFIPNLKEGEIYKYYIKSKYKGKIRIKSDPYGFFFEKRPETGTVVYDINKKYKWQDAEWMEARVKTNYFNRPISIYEVHLGSWIRKPNGDFFNYRELAEKLIPYVREMGFTHIELLPITEHPLDGSWGYQCSGYFAPTSRYGTPEDFMYFIDSCHQAGIGIILDWVPGHFPKDDHFLCLFDGTCLYEYEDPRKAEHKDWGTLIFNYSKAEVKNFLLASAFFWLDRYHIDGIRIDAVTSMLYLDYSKDEWEPNIYGGKENLEAIEFLKKFNEVVKNYFPGVITIAEESTAWPGVSRPTYMGGLGFSMKCNIGWMNDTLQYFSKDPLYRKYHHNNLTFGILYAFSENFLLPLSHDEVVHGKKSLIQKMPGDKWQKFANLRALFGYMYGYPGKKLLFMGGEFGQWKEWDYNSSLQWELLEEESHEKLRKYIKDLNYIYNSEPALYETDHEHKGFEWIDFSDSDQSIISFIRKARNPENFLIFVCNFTPIPRYGYIIGVPQEGFYKEVLNSDSELYGGSNIGNLGGVHAKIQVSHRYPYSIELTLPPLAILILKLQSL